jgi:putative phosphoribosyl transferase
MHQHMSIQQAEVTIHAGKAAMEGILSLPNEPRGLVAFAHGSGSSRLSPRNRMVAESLNDADFGTLLFDLLTSAEQQIDEWTGHLRFDVGLLGARLIDAVDWLTQSERTRELPIGLFGASTGAAGALVAAAERPEAVRAVVSRGGRPDLAGDALRSVMAPTLLIVGGNDTVVIDLNREAAHSLKGPHRLEVVPGASHLFEEPGKIEEVAALARDWFLEYLPAAVAAGHA